MRTGDKTPLTARLKRLAAEGIHAILARKAFHPGATVIFGGARCDEEKSRAKERIFWLRSATHGWSLQIPVLPLYCAKQHPAVERTDWPDTTLALLNARHSDDQGRAIGCDAVARMEKKKQEGYF